MTSGISSLDIEKALRRAWSLGQDYWRQADSESYKQNKLADETRAKFDALVSETLAAPSHPPASAVMGEVRMLTQKDYEDCRKQWMECGPGSFSEAIQRKFMEVNAGKTIPAANEAKGGE